MEDWELELIKKNDCVAEAKLLEKYKNLVYFDQDNETTYTVHDGNLEFRRQRKDGGWHLICVSDDDKKNWK